MALLESGPSGGGDDGDDGGGDDGGEKSDSGSDTAASALPDGWREMNDETTGRTYFFNADSGESKWLRPSETRDAKIAAQEKRLRDNPWKKQTNDDGRTYYCPSNFCRTLFRIGALHCTATARILIPAESAVS